MNANRDIEKNPDPLVLPAPWPDDDPAEIVTPEERAALRADLISRSAFAH
ncbi:MULTISPECIES: hypothetical protein [unclassified Cryobacterium]|nr:MULTISPECIES: hypothetical protein [unclassified Cryobacterium]